MSNHAGSIVAHKHPSDFVGAKLAMWLFLFTEILLFGGLFIMYAAYRSTYPADFHTAATELNTPLGAFNTLVLLTSSLTVVLSIEALQRGARKLSIGMLTTTIGCGLIFLVVKYFEWSAKIHHGIFPGSEELLTHSDGEVLFFNLYYAMTGLHGLHVIVGMAVLTGVLYFIVRKPVNKEEISYEMLEKMRGKARLVVVANNGNEIGTIADIDPQTERVNVKLTYEPVPEKNDPRNLIKLENSALYWHLVDIIWIFLFPLFYLIT
ncbi:MAG: cytochrome c oxidase subunit 3 family protein [Calditrichae bacterium]|nr:cytochrome c oxidase subunit 3 family protein [Calditrichia bacterium]